MEDVSGGGGLQVDPDIRRARTLPARVYCDPEVLRLQRERVFARTWHLVGDADQVKVAGQVQPLTLLEGLLDEPLLLSRDEGDCLHLVSNVCTHRGNLVVESAGVAGQLRCRYHGRRFGLDGRFQSMPEFEGVEGFPGPADDLAGVPFGAWGKLLFASLEPAFPLAEALRPLAERCGFLPLGEARLDPGRSREYLVHANWALYCDNYLEGFHIPYIHAGLAGALEYGAYRTELLDWGSLQVGFGAASGDAFDLPPGSPDQGRRVAAYYFWLFPATMINVYPWGISANLVRPLAVDRTRVSFLSYVWDPSRLGQGAGADLDRVEREDEAVVERVARGVRARLYPGGRYSPRRETGVHHFHRLLARFLAAG